MTQNSLKLSWLPVTFNFTAFLNSLRTFHFAFFQTFVGLLRKQLADENSKRAWPESSSSTASKIHFSMKLSLFLKLPRLQQMHKKEELKHFFIQLFGSCFFIITVSTLLVQDTVKKFLCTSLVSQIRKI